LSNQRFRVPLIFCNIDADTGFEFDGEVVGEDRDLLNEPSDRLLVEDRDLSFLLADEVLQLLDSVHGLGAAVAVDGGFFLLLVEPEELVGDGIVALLLAVAFMMSSFCSSSIRIRIPSGGRVSVVTTALATFSCSWAKKFFPASQNPV
jgi:hypothetical protein